MTPPVFIVAYFTGFIVASAIRLVYSREYRRRIRKEGKRPTPDTPLVYLPALGFFIVPLIFVLTPILSFADYALPFWAGLAGTGIFALAIWLLWRSHADLGRYFSPVIEVVEGQRLVTDGVYRRIRHPMYTAHLLWGVSQPLLLWNWVAGFALLATFVPFIVVRMPAEERAMRQQFGGEYETYEARTGRLLPRFG
ncbi:MAG: isoprenylcysteine carboxylmethyltransferase family protein [Methanomicrobiales archaeon]|nr:isoprenylcysteine carboxylmethyltransferase family protein [Methanomicrobiales archaeon]